MVCIQKKWCWHSEHFSEMQLQLSEGFFLESKGFFSGRLLPKSAGFVHSKVQCSFVYGSSAAAFVMAKQHSNGSGFHKCMPSLLTCTVGAGPPTIHSKTQNATMWLLSWNKHMPACISFLESPLPFFEKCWCKLSLRCYIQRSCNRWELWPLRVH